MRSSDIKIILVICSSSNFRLQNIQMNVTPCLPHHLKCPMVSWCWCWRLKLLEKFPGGGTDDWGVSSRNFNSLNLIKTVGDQWDGHWLSWWWWWWWDGSVWWWWWWWDGSVWWWWWWDGSVWWKLCVSGVSVSILSSLHTLNTLNTHWLSLVRQLPAPAHTAALQTHTCDTHCSDQSSALFTRRHQPGRAFNRWDHSIE